jgi:MraZ protein
VLHGYPQKWQRLGYCVTQWDDVQYKWDEVGNCQILKIMLIGEYRHTMDDKNRLSLPAKFRKEMGKKIIITRGLDRCLFVYPISEWKKFSQQLANLSIGSAEGRGFSRAMLGGATEIDVDSSGRVLVPDHLKSYASLATKVVVAGIHNRIELWNEEAWNKYTNGVEKEANVLAQKLADIGMI